MKKIIIDFGKGLIDISAIIWLLIISLGLIIAFVITSSQDSFIAMIVTGIAALVALIIFVLSYFLLYLLIDINDNLIEINSKLQSKSLKKKSKEEHSNYEQEEFTQKYLINNVDTQIDEKNSQKALESNQQIQNEQQEDNFLNKGIYKR